MRRSCRRPSNSGKLNEARNPTGVCRITAVRVAHPEATEFDKASMGNRLFFGRIDSRRTYLTRLRTSVTGIGWWRRPPSSHPSSSHSGRASFRRSTSLAIGTNSTGGNTDERDGVTRWQFECAEFQHRVDPEPFSLRLIADFEDGCAHSGALKVKLSARNLRTPFARTFRIQLDVAEGDTISRIRG